MSRMNSAPRSLTSRPSNLPPAPLILNIRGHRWLFRRSGFVRVDLRDRAEFRIEIGRGRFGHSVAAKVGSVFVAHDLQHVGDGHLAARFGLVQYGAGSFALGAAGTGSFSTMHVQNLLSLGVDGFNLNS